MLSLLIISILNGSKRKNFGDGDNFLKSEGRPYFLLTGLG
jgi:hypothetical protein